MAAASLAAVTPLPLSGCPNESLGTAAYLNRGLRSSRGGEWLWGGGCPIVPRAPGLIWVHGPWAGDVMVDGSIRWERLRPLILRMTAALGRESRQPRDVSATLWGILGNEGLVERGGW